MAEHACWGAFRNIKIQPGKEDTLYINNKPLLIWDTTDKRFYINPSFLPSGIGGRVSGTGLRGPPGPQGPQGPEGQMGPQGPVGTTTISELNRRVLDNIEDTPQEPEESFEPEAPIPEGNVEQMSEVDEAPLPELEEGNVEQMSEVDEAPLPELAEGNIDD